ncbi:tumor necrosis factor receptor superfamily member 14-like isoform X2 [Oncorhynchus clarkii lewisi]|uniref:tumor necrosis factor receptor superfamily member 14-like isoform X2 n=1 Tax=Oncorhynchus clarkii lewisi TaxID=490388 RepID=UPI0039B8AD53
MFLTLRRLPSEQYFLLGFHFVLVFGKDCGPAEYKTNDGLVVRRDCTLESSTSCMPCIRGTFMNEANGLTKCFPCSPCDPGQGLFTQTECKPTSNTVCDVLDGYYCRSYSSNSECSLAVEHTHCSPGQSTKSPGTKTTDTVCEECQHGFYSQHGVNCTAWTDCAAMGRVKTEDGHSRQDVICNKVPPRIHTTLIAPILLLLGLTVAALFGFYLARAILTCVIPHRFLCKKRDINKSPVTNSLVETAENVPGNVVTD